MAYNRQYCHQALAKRDMNWSVPNPTPITRRLLATSAPLHGAVIACRKTTPCSSVPATTTGQYSVGFQTRRSGPAALLAHTRACLQPVAPLWWRSAANSMRGSAITPDAIFGTTAVAWHLHMSGIPHIRHYLDDFIIIGLPGSAQCGESLGLLDHKCQCLGVPTAAQKTDSPTTCLKYLGIEVDTAAGLLRLPDDKLHHLQALLLQWEARQTCTQKELKSLVELLNHACKVILPGQTFLLHSVHQPLNSLMPIRLNQGFRDNLAWWHEFLSAWNGVSFLCPPGHRLSVIMTSNPLALGAVARCATSTGSRYNGTTCHSL